MLPQHPVGKKRYEEDKAQVVGEEHAKLIQAEVLLNVLHCNTNGFFKINVVRL